MGVEDSGSGGDAAAASPLVSCRISSQSSVRRILLMLQSEDLNFRLQAAEEIRRVTKASPTCRSYLSEAIEPLVGMLGSSSVVAIKASLAALLNLAVPGEVNKISIVKAGALRPLVGFLLSENLPLQELAVAVIATLSESSTNKTIIGSCGAIPLLVQILRLGTLQAKSDALKALYNLSSHKDNLMELRQAEPIPPLVDVLKSSRRSSSTTGECTALIEFLMDFEEARTALINEDGGVLAVVEVLECGSLQNREYAVGALLTMCQSDRSKYREPILREGVVPGLLELTVQGTPKSRAKAQLLLKHLRETPYPSSELQLEALDNVVCEIVSQIEMEEMCGRSKRMFAEMVQLSMELSLKRIQNHALDLASSGFSVNNSCSIGMPPEYRRDAGVGNVQENGTHEA